MASPKQSTLKRTFVPEIKPGPDSMNIYKKLKLSAERKNKGSTSSSHTVGLTVREWGEKLDKITSKGKIVFDVPIEKTRSQLQAMSSIGVNSKGALSDNVRESSEVVTTPANVKNKYDSAPGRRYPALILTDDDDEDEDDVGSPACVASEDMKRWEEGNRDHLITLEEEMEFLNRLAVQFKTIPMKGDGNCFYTAIAQSLYEDPSRQIEVRKKVYERFLEPDFEFPLMSDRISCLQKVLRDKEYADEYSVKAAAEALKISIVILKPRNRFPIRHQPEVSVKKTVYLKYVGQHYDLLMPIDESSLNIKFAVTETKTNSKHVPSEDNARKEMEQSQNEEQQLIINSDLSCHSRTTTETSSFQPVLKTYRFRENASAYLRKARGALVDKDDNVKIIELFRKRRQTLSLTKISENIVVVCGETDCYEVITSNRQAKNHYKAKHDIEIYSCSYCEGEPLCLDILTHYNRSHSGKMICAFCQIKTANLKQLSLHTEQCHNIQCGYNLPDIGNEIGVIVNSINDLVLPTTSFEVFVKHLEGFDLLKDKDTNATVLAYVKLTDQHISKPGSTRYGYNFFNESDVEVKNEFNPHVFQVLGGIQGHLVSANHFQTMPDACKDTFNYGNIFPMLSRFNVGLWRRGETHEERINRNKIVVHCLSGPIFNYNLNPLINVPGPQPQALPVAFFKVLFLENARKVVACQSFIFPNKNYLEFASIFSYAANITEINEKTGLNIRTDIMYTWHEQVPQRPNEFTAYLLTEAKNAQRLYKDAYKLDNELCRECNMPIGTEHAKLVHEERKTKYTCEVESCKKQFCAQTALTNHRLTVHLLCYKFYCPHCFMGRMSKTAIDNHIELCKYKHRKNVFKCTQCVFAYETRNKLLRHINLRHSESKKVVAQQNSSKRIVDVKGVKSRRNAKGNFSCKIAGCRKTFDDSRFLAEHVRTHLENIVPKEKSKQKKAHSKSEGQPNKFSCLFCKKAYQSPFKLRLHIDNFHSQEKESKRCDFCGQKFVSDTDLKRHTRSTHLMPKIFKCNDCTFTTTNIHQLNTHVRIHYPDKKFSCKYCPQIFGREITKNAHEKAHESNQNMMQCKICQIVLTSKSIMRAHMAVRHGINKFTS